ncbi:GNAT family N-acetyltransferase [Poritiphilus flavus]|uniref:GNAT family N-acetyltransferase n=1 Tax=Poritiphilus flavus TaxID=2697053 RepID=A0A6L9EHA0_9FLAO|nr:GNAT family N-acetyltransferase [Poritiphilus flavus]NAS14170.1 GNAT family N-acetyltransferase [Poritiphilus flavus]
MSFNLQPVLVDDRILLAPLQAGDLEALYQVASDPLIWEQHQEPERYQRHRFGNYFAEAIASGAALKIVLKANGELIGCSRYKIIDEDEGVIEIGWSFLACEYWGGDYNRAVKKLMINYALTHFDKVIFYVNKYNQRSRKAVEKIGGKFISPGATSWALEEESNGVTYLINSKLS